MGNIAKMEEMFDPDFDPLNDLEQCIMMIAHQQRVIDSLLKTQNIMLDNQQKLNQMVANTRHSIDILQTQINEVKQTTTNNRPRR